MAYLTVDTAGMSNQPEKINPNSMTVSQLARLLTATGQMTITEEMIEQDIKDGSPTNPDGTINLIHHTAWLTKEYLDARRRSKKSSPD